MSGFYAARRMILLVTAAWILACVPPATRGGVMECINLELERVSVKEEMDLITGLLGENRFEDALDMVTRELDKHPENPHLRALHGIVLLKSGQVPAAEQILEKLAIHYPGLSIAQCGMGKIAHIHNDPVMAEHYLRQALNGTDLLDDTLMYLVRVKMDLGKIGEALELKECYSRYYEQMGRPTPDYLAWDPAMKEWYPEDRIMIIPDTFRSVTVPLKRRETGEIQMIPIAINGSRDTFDVDIDSASPGLLDISPLLAQELGIKGYGETDSVGVGKAKISTQWAWLDSIRIGDLVIENVPVHILDSHTFTGKKKGLLGTGLLRRFNCTIDVKQGSFTLYSREYPDLLAAAVNMDRLASRMPIYLFESTMVTATVEDGPDALFFLDTAAGTCLLDHDYFDRYLRPGADPGRIKKYNITGAGGTEQTDVYPEARLVMGDGYPFSSLVVLFPMNRLNRITRRYAAGLIGYPELWKHRVHFDFNVPELILEHYPADIE